jgi:hypothetical protein
MTESQAENVCPMCGAAITATSRQCRACGEKMGATKPSLHLPALSEVGNYVYLGMLGIPVLVAIVVAVLLPVIAWFRHWINPC